MQTGDISESLTVDWSVFHGVCLLCTTATD